MAEKTSQTNSSSNNLPSVPAVAPTSDTPYIQPIIGKLGYDTKHPDIFGIGASPDNGVSFRVFASFDGLVFNDNDIDAIWDNGTSEKVKSEVNSATAEIPAVKLAADEAVKKADSAITSSKVNSDAIVAQSEAISEAKSAISSATAEIQQTAATAAIDAAKIRADVAQVQNEVDTAKAANSASVEALKSDVSAAKQDLADVHDSLTKAQSAIEQNQKLINDSVAKITSDVSATKQDLATVHDSLAKAQATAEQNQKAINDSIAQINANVDATNQDLTGVRKDLTKAQSDITANQKAVNDNVAQINSNIEQDRKDIASAQQANADTAKQLDTYSKQAQEQGKTIKSIQDKQDGFTATIADVQGNVTQVSDKVDGLSASLKDAQDNVASVKAQADQLSATLTDHAKSIATLTASAKELSSTLEDADGRLSKVEQTAQTNSSTLSDVQGDLSQVKQDATTLTATLKDAQGNISTLQQKADSVSAQLASAQGDIATLQTGVDGVKATLTSHDKSIHTLQADSKSLKDSMVNAQGDISTLRKTATDVTSELEDHTGRLSKVERSAAKQETTLSDLQGNLSQVEQKADSNTTTISSINKNAMQDRGVITDTKTSFDSLTQLGTYSIKAISLPKMPEQHYGTLAVSGSAGSGWISQQFVADTTGNVYTRVFSNNVWSAWKQGGSQDAINQVKQTADSNSATIRNVQGDVSTLKQTATGVEAALADHEGDIHTLQADDKSLKDSMADAQGDISTLSKTATSLDSEMKDHAGRLSKVEQTAQTNSSTLSDVQGDLSQVKQQADGLVSTLKDAQGDIDQIKQTAKGTAEQLSNAQGDITALQKDVNGIKLTIADHDKNIHTLQADSKTLKDDMADAKGNISSLQKTSTSLVSEFKDHDGRLSKVEQTASTLTNEFSDQQGHLNRVEQTANGTQQTVADHAGDIATLQSDANMLTSQMSSAQGDISTLKQTASGFSSKVSGIETSLADVNSKINDITSNGGGRNLLIGTSTASGDVADGDGILVQGAFNGYDAVKTNGAWSERYINLQSALGRTNAKAGDWYTISVYVKADKQINTGFLDVYRALGNVDANANDGFLDGITWQTKPITTQWQQYAWSFQINDISLQRQNTRVEYSQDTGDNWIYWAGWMLEKGIIAHDWSPAPEDTDAKITANSTAIEQNKKAIALKADQTTVDNLSGEVSQNSAQLKVQADQISSKVSSTDFKTLNDKVDGMKIGGRNLVAGTAEPYTMGYGIPNTTWQNGYAYESLPTKILTSEILPQNDQFYANLVPGREYTQTIWFETDADVKKLNATITWFTNVGHDQQPAKIIKVGENSYKLFSTYTWPGKTDNNVRLFDILYLQYAFDLSVGTYIKFGKLKLEEGNISTDWTPAPEDLTTAIQKNSTDIDQTKQKISLKADQTEVDKVKQTASQNSSRLDVMAGQISSKVSSADVEKLVDGKGFATKDLVESSITQASGKINETITNLQGNLQNITADLTGLQSTVKDKADQSQITQLTNIVQSKVSSKDYQTTISQLTNDINAKVAKGDLMSQINIEAGRLLFQSNKIFLDADTIVFSKNSKAFIPDAAIENLSLDKLTTGHITVPIADKYGNQIELGNDGINVSSTLDPIDWSGSGTGYQDDKSRFSFNVSSHGMSFTNHIEYGKSTVKTHASDDYQFLNLTPDVLHYTNGSTDQVKVPSGMTMYVPVNATSTLGPKSPGGFFAIGHEQIGDNGATSDKTIDIAYVAKQINGWKQGLHVNTTIYSKPAGASHNMRTAWVSWSNWDNGEHYPAIVSDGKWWGGVAFPSSGKVTIFDPYGHAMWLTQGNTPYSAWGDDYYS